MKILIVCEKISIQRRLEEFLNNNKEKFNKNDYYFDSINPVSHINDGLCRFRKKKDGKIYHANERTDFISLKLDSINIPEDTFIINIRENSYRKLSLFDNDFDLIISATDCDSYGILGFKKYEEIYGLKNTKRIDIYDLTDKSFERILNLEDIYEFEIAFEKLKKNLLKNNFETEYPRKEDVLKLRQSYNMTRTEFCKYFNIPYRTVENWENDISLCPSYLYELMKYKLEKEKIW